MHPKLYTALAFILIVTGLHAQQQLFHFNGFFSAPSKNMIIKGTKLRLDRAILAILEKERASVVRLEIPIDNKIVILNLKKVELFRQNFQVIVSSTLDTFNYAPGYYLQGTIEGEDHSFAAISIFNDYAGGVLSYKGDNYNLVVANNRNDYQTDDYIIYADKDCLAERPKCFTKDDSAPLLMNRNIPRTSFIGCPVDVYFETGVDMYTTLGGITQVMNYLTILFNAEQLLYSNENILIQLREVKVWTSPEPESSAPDASTALSSFTSRMGSTGFNGDIAHYATFNHLGGGVAWLDILCGTLRTGVSGNLSPIYLPYPNFSFSVTVITHEMGHNIGSPHTHSCTWPGGAIDDCYATEGGCPAGPHPMNGGTIMSYCHTVPTGINFANGFGPLPGDLIRTKVTDASAISCICDCGNIQMDVTKQDIGCGNPTGSASATVTGGTGPFTYAWSDGSVGATVTGLSAGTYYVTVTGAAPNCKVIKGFKIINTGSAISLLLTPSTSTVVKCLNEVYNISSAVSPAGTYSYQWYKNAVAIPGATNSSLAITSAVANTASYYVTVNGGSCIGQSATTTVSFQDIPVPVITAAATSICEGQSVLLSVPPVSSFSTEWSLNGVVIPGATSANFNAAAAGNYTVKRFSPTNTSCFAISAPISITIKPSPSAATSPATLAFCIGDQGTITHSPVAGETYSWYQNNVLIAGATTNNLQVTSAGNYFIKVMGANGCYNSSPVIAVTVNPLPNALLNPANSITLCDGGTLALSATSFSQAQYNWFNAGQEIASGTNSTLSVTQSGSYSVKITNTLTGCINTSSITIVSIIPPPAIFAGNDTIIATGQPYMLHVKELTSIGVNHYEWIPSTGLNDPNVSNPTATLMHNQEYTVRGVYPSGCIAEDKVLIRVIKGPAIYVPSAFSPNGDNMNDILVCTAVGLSSFRSFTIFNRFGQKIFYTTELSKGWDGRWKGAPLTIGSYIYVAEGIDYKGKPVVSKGSVTIIL